MNRRHHDNGPQLMSLGLARRRRLVVVDAHGHAFRAFWGLEPMYAPDGMPINALYGLAGLLRRLVLEDRPDFIAVVFDAPDDRRCTFRSQLYPEYKAHRPERPAELAKQIPMLRDVAQTLGLATLEHPEFEADDIVATVVAEAESADVHTTILSADKDLLQLVSARTLVWDAMRGKRYTPAGVEDKLGVAPRQVADYLALVGDSSDNVPGVPGIGAKGASSLLRAFGSLEAIYARIDEIPTRERRKLVAHRDRAELSAALTHLRRDVPIDCSLERLASRVVPLGRAQALWQRLGFPAFDSGEERGWRGPAPREPAGAPIRVSPAGASPPPAVSREPPEDEPLLDGPSWQDELSEPIEINDLDGLRQALEEARGALALGLAMRGEPPERLPARRSRRSPPTPSPVAPPVLGMALPCGTCWRIVVDGGERARPGRPVQGRLFAEPESAAGLALADVAAGVGSLLADRRRVLCVSDAKRLLPTLNIAAQRFAFDAALDQSGGPASIDPAADALAALAGWLEDGVDNARVSSR